MRRVDSRKWIPKRKWVKEGGKGGILDCAKQWPKIRWVRERGKETLMGAWKLYPKMRWERRGGREKIGKLQFSPKTKCVRVEGKLYNSEFTWRKRREEGRCDSLRKYVFNKR